MLLFVLSGASVMVMMVTPATTHTVESEALKPHWWQGDDFSWVRGVDCVSGFAYNSYAQWDKYDPQAVDRELAYATKRQLDSVRMDIAAARELSKEKALILLVSRETIVCVWLLLFAS